MMILEPVAFALYIGLTIAAAMGVKHLLCRLIPPFKRIIDKLEAVPEDEYIADDLIYKPTKKKTPISAGTDTGAQVKIIRVNDTTAQSITQVIGEKLYDKCTLPEPCR